MTRVSDERIQELLDETICTYAMSDFEKRKIVASELIELCQDIQEARTEIVYLKNQHQRDCEDMHLVRSGLVKHSREFVRMHDEHRKTSEAIRDIKMLAESPNSSEEICRMILKRIREVGV